LTRTHLEQQIGWANAGVQKERTQHLQLLGLQSLIRVATASDKLVSRDLRAESSPVMNVVKSFHRSAAHDGPHRRVPA